RRAVARHPSGASPVPGGRDRRCRPRGDLHPEPAGRGGQAGARAVTRQVRLAYLVTHPIQYQAPLLRRLASEPDIELKVFFRSDSSIRGGQIDPGFGKRIEWDVPLLEGYAHEFLPAIGGRSVLEPPWRPFSHGLGRRLRAGRFDALWVHGYAWPYHWLAM